MTQSKKYDCQVVQDNTGWSANIIRRVTSKKTVLTKSQSGFSSEAEAQDWGQKEVKSFLKAVNLNEQKKRYSQKS